MSFRLSLIPCAQLCACVGNVYECLGINVTATITFSLIRALSVSSYRSNIYYHDHQSIAHIQPIQVTPFTNIDDDMLK